MKPFNLSAAKEGKPLVTRDGRKATFIGVSDACPKWAVAVYLEGNSAVTTFSRTGMLLDSEAESQSDLFLADPPKVKKEAYLVAMRSGETLFSGLFTQKENISDYLKLNPQCTLCGEIIHHTWEEEAV